MSVVNYVARIRGADKSDGCGKIVPAVFAIPHTSLQKRLNSQAMHLFVFSGGGGIYSVR